MRLGGDPVQMIDVERALRAGATGLDRVDADLAHAARDLRWRGSGRDRFDRQLAAIGHGLRSAGAALRNAADDVRRQAGDQQRASSAWRVGGAAGRHLARHPDETVLAYDARGDGRIVVALGDPATASHVAVLVGGMGSSLATVDRQLTDARRLVASARRLGGATAVVVWLDYDAPRPWTDVLHLGEVLDDARARSGARDLRVFVGRLDERTDATITLVGHSYGSLVVADSAVANPHVDRVLVLGSPGLGVGRARDLHLAAGTELYADATRADLVARSGWFGTPPTSPRFGAIVLDAGGPANPLVAHSAYFETGSVALAEIAAVVTGRVTRAR